MNNSDITHFLELAQAAQNAGDAEQAIAHYNAVLRIAPGHPAALNSLGVMALASRQIGDAVNFHDRAAKADPGAAVLWINLAKAHRMAGDDDAERASLEQALAIDQTLFPALVRKAQLLERLGDHVQALMAWHGVIAMAPANSGGGLDDLLAHAHNFVRTKTEYFAETVDAGLAAVRSGSEAELRRFDACVGYMTGRRRIYVNECAATHFPFLPAYEFFDRTHFSWLGDLERQTEVICTELKSLLSSGAPGFEPYVQMAPGTPENKWSALDASTAWSAYHLWHYGRPVEEAQSRCPDTVAALTATPQLSLHSRCPNAFFSILQPGARIPPHTGVTNVRSVVHLPLIVPPDCGFRVGGETREWRVGEAFVFDDTIEHEAWNNSDQIRAVLILDVWNPYLTDVERVMMQHYFKIADASGLDPGAADDF